VNRAQARATEHTEVAPMNMRLALERRAESEQVMPGIPGIRLVVGQGWGTLWLVLGKFPVKMANSPRGLVFDCY
jgi:hypothetical protein